MSGLLSKNRKPSGFTVFKCFQVILKIHFSFSYRLRAQRVKVGMVGEEETEDPNFKDAMETVQNGDDVFVDENSLSTSTSAPPKSYSSIVGTNFDNSSADSLLDKAKGVLIKRVAGVTLPEFLTSLGKVINPKSVIYADYVGAANFGVWLDSVESVDALVARDTLEVKGQMTKIYRYVNPIKRVVLRHVPPFLPDPVINDYLKKYGEIRSALEHQSCYGVGEEFSHVKSFTRTVNLSMNEGVVIPPQIKVKWQGTTHTIYTQVGAKKCFKCGKKGHVSNACPNKNNTVTPSNKKLPASSATADESQSEQVDSQSKSRGQKRGSTSGDYTEPLKKTRLGPQTQLNDSSNFNFSQMSGISDSENDIGGGSTSDADGFTAPRPRRQRAKGTGGKFVATGENDAPWASNIWMKNSNFKKYNSINKEGLKIFLYCLRPTDDGKGFVDLEKMVNTFTKSPQELQDFIYEIMQSLGLARAVVKADLNKLYNLIGDFMCLEPSEKVKFEVDNNFRKNVMTWYQRIYTKSETDMVSKRKYFFI